jgi:hypothetical protein
MIIETQLLRILKLRKLKEKRLSDGRTKLQRENHKVVTGTGRWLMTYAFITKYLFRN